MAGPRALGTGSASRSLPVPKQLLSAPQLFLREPRPRTESAATARARGRRAPRPPAAPASTRAPPLPPTRLAPSPQSPPRACRLRPVRTLAPPRPERALLALSSAGRGGAALWWPSWQVQGSLASRPMHHQSVTCLPTCPTDPFACLAISV